MGENKQRLKFLIKIQTDFLITKKKKTNTGGKWQNISHFIFLFLFFYFVS